jgi:hypothetical protein
VNEIFIIGLVLIFLLLVLPKGYTMRIYTTRSGLNAVILDNFEGFVVKENKPILTKWNTNLCNSNPEWDLMEQQRNVDGLWS